MPIYIIRKSKGKNHKAARRMVADLAKQYELTTYPALVVVNDFAVLDPLLADLAEHVVLSDDQVLAIGARLANLEDQIADVRQQIDASFPDEDAVEEAVMADYVIPDTHHGDTESTEISEEDKQFLATVPVVFAGVDWGTGDTTVVERIPAPEAYPPVEKEIRRPSGSVEELKECPECGKMFDGRKKFCSSKCYGKDWRRRKYEKVTAGQPEKVKNGKKTAADGPEIIVEKYGHNPDYFPTRTGTIKGKRLG